MDGVVRLKTAFKAFCFGIAFPCAATAMANEQAYPVERASISSAGQQGDMFSVRPEVSGDGSKVAFISMSSNLAAGVTMPGMSIYLREPGTHSIRLVSAAADGKRANAASVDPGLSANGRYAVFSSNATNLVTDSTFGHKQAFRKDLVSGEVIMLSVGADGEAQAFDSANPVASADGSSVAFMSFAALAPGCAAGRGNIYVRDIEKRTTVCLSGGMDGAIADGGSLQPAISADGTIVAFSSTASNLVPGDTNRIGDIFVRDLAQGRTMRVSLGPGGAEGNAESIEPSLSGDGSRVVFSSASAGLVAGVPGGTQRIYLRNLRTGVTSLVGPASGAHLADQFSGQPRISADGTTVVFLSAATNLVRGADNGKRNIYRWSVDKQVMSRVSAPRDGGNLNGDCFQPAVSANGSIVAFRSNAANLVDGDTNLTDDVFVEVQQTP